MNGPAVEDRVVVLVDLRTMHLPTLLAQPFSRTQARLAAVGGGAGADLRRAVVVDDVRLLAEHHRVYEHILGTDVDVSVLCVAVGVVDNDDAAAALRRPALLGPPRAATLWVGDVDGVGWRMEGSQAQVVHSSGDTPDGTVRAVPEALMRALLLPQVFDRVVEAVGTMPGAVASPGVRVLQSDLDDEVLRTAQSSAIRRLTDVDGAWSGLSSPPSQIAVTLMDGGRAAVDPINKGGRFQQHLLDVVKSADESGVLLSRLARPSAMLRHADGRLAPALARLASATQVLAADAGVVFELVDPASRGADSARATDLGVIPTAISPQASAAALTAVRDSALDGLGSRRPLPEIAARLRATTDGAGTRGSTAYRERLRNILPDTLAERLDGRSTAARRWLRPDRLLVTVVASALSALWPTPGGLGALLTAGVVPTAALWTRRRMSAQTRGPRPSWTATAFYGLAGVAGAGAGFTVQRQTMAAPSAAALSIGVSAVLAGVVGGLLSILWWWSAVRAWAADLGVDTIAAKAHDVRSLVEQAAREGRRTGQHQNALYDYTRVLAAVVDDLADGLRTTVENAPDGYGGTPEAGRTVPAFADRDPENRLKASAADVDALVTMDLCDIAASVLATFATVPRPGEAQMVDGEAVRAKLATLIDDYRRHLRVSGIHHAPPLCSQPTERQARVDAVWQANARLSDLVWTGPRDARIVQLCDAAQLMLLDVESAELVRFVPNAARALVGPAPRSAGGGTAVVWTGASQAFGMMRLVGLRPGLVEEIWPTDVPAAPARPANSSLWVGPAGPNEGSGQTVPPQPTATADSSSAQEDPR